MTYKRKDQPINGLVCLHVCLNAQSALQGHHISRHVARPVPELLETSRRERVRVRGPRRILELELGETLG